MKKYFVLGRLEQPRQNKNLLYLHYEPNEPTKEEPLSYVLLESPFASDSAVSSRGHPSLGLSGCDKSRAMLTDIVITEAESKNFRILMLFI
jgi:hypothetical protein